MQRDFTRQEILNIGNFINALTALKNASLERLKTITWYEPFASHYDNIIQEHNDLVAKMGGSNTIPVPKENIDEYNKQWQDVLQSKVKIQYEEFDIKLKM